MTTRWVWLAASAAAAATIGVATQRGTAEERPRGAAAECASGVPAPTCWVRFDDGTRCVVVAQQDAGAGAAIDCEFR